MNGDRAFIAVVAVFVAVLILIWRRNYYRSRRVRPLPRELDLTRRRYTLAELLAADPRDPGTWPEVPPLAPARPVVHQTPDYDAVPDVTPCCSVPVAWLPADETFTSEPQKVTCGKTITEEEK